MTNDLNTHQAAKFLQGLGLKISASWLRILRCKGGDYVPASKVAPKFKKHRMTGLVTYREQDLKRFARENYPRKF